MHIGSLDKMKKFVDKYLKDYQDKNLKILDVGSQDVNGSYKQFFNSPKWNYTGLDMVPGNNVDVVLKDVYNWTEIKSNSYDVIVTGQVFEHVEYIWVTILEIARTLKEGGLCCIIAPSNGSEHRYPVDCWRYYPDGFRALAKYAGLNVLEVYTQWQNVGYPDGSDIWKDSVLICQKPTLSAKRKLEAFSKNIFAKVISGVKVDQKDLEGAVNYYLEKNNKINDNSELIKILAEIENHQNIENNVEKLCDYDIEDIINIIDTESKASVTLLNTIAVTYFNKKVYDNILPLLNEAYEIEHGNADTLYNLGYVLYSFREYKLAVKYLELIKDPDEEVKDLISLTKQKISM